MRTSDWHCYRGDPWRLQMGPILGELPHGDAYHFFCPETCPMRPQEHRAALRWYFLTLPVVDGAEEQATDPGDLAGCHVSER